MRSHLFLLLLPLCLSCRKDLSPFGNPVTTPANNYPALFESFWNGMNTHYVFWSIDTTDWDAMHTRYKPLFDKLGDFDTANERMAEGYFSAMTHGMIDGHYSIIFWQSGSSYIPSAARRAEADPNYYSDSLLPAVQMLPLQQKYIDSATLVTGSDVVPDGSEFVTMTAFAGTIGSRALYLNFSHFGISNAGTGTTPVFNYFFNTLRHLPPQIKGIILDLRGNEGGEITDLDYVVGQMISQPVTFGYTRTKNGPNRLDYGPWAPAIAKPWNGGVDVKVPIVVLGDHRSTSMSELTIMAIKTLPNGKYIGTRTWGATGPISDSAWYDGGPFTIGGAYFGGNGYLYTYTSTAQFKYVNGDVYEGVGVPPDVYALETQAAFDAQHDLVIDAALQYIDAH